VTERRRGASASEDPASETLLFGTISLDRYVDGGPALPSGDVLPGGGILNMAWQWRRLGRPFTVLTRVGDEDGGPIRAFLERHSIPHLPSELVAPGTSSSIDIRIEPDRQPFMDNFVGGVWDGLRTTPAERAAIGDARRLHSVLVEGTIAELARLAAEGALRHLAVSADFLGFRHYTVERLAQTMAHVDVGFIGWPGAEDAIEVDGMRGVAWDLERLLVVTMGARAVHVFDGRRGARSERRFSVTPVPVAGTTLGCGDAFIAWFLDELWRTDDVARAVARGQEGGALATRWLRPLPDEAYATLTPAAPAASPSP
jgi:sugar/nucleoside kinase (ribokinase family)